MLVFMFSLRLVCMQHHEVYELPFEKGKNVHCRILFQEQDLSRKRGMVVKR